MEIVDIAWLAGLLEGEGSFMFSQPSHRLSGNLVISIQSSDRDVVAKVARLLKAASVYELRPRRLAGHPGTKTMYMTVQRKSYVCAGWMMTLYSLMSIRRKAKIREVLNLRTLSVDHRGKRRKS